MIATNDVMTFASLAFFFSGDADLDGAEAQARGAARCGALTS
jgi:hypothetical protein